MYFWKIIFKKNFYVYFYVASWKVEGTIIIKDHIFWEGHKNLRNLRPNFVYMYCRQK